MPADPVPENSVTGDNERQAEIEAATDALLADSGLPRYGGHRATIERRMGIAFDALDRVRDARHDDEAVRPQGVARVVEAVRTGGLSERKAVPAARSPQGEDHETGIEAARECFQMILAQARMNWRSGYAELATKGLKALSRVSPARDARPGTTTAEDDTAKLVEALRRIADPHAPLSPSRAQIAYEALAEFAPDDTPHPTDPAPAPDKGPAG